MSWGIFSVWYLGNYFFTSIIFINYIETGFSICFFCVSLETGYLKSEKQALIVLLKVIGIQKELSVKKQCLYFIHIKKIIFIFQTQRTILKDLGLMFIIKLVILFDRFTYYNTVNRRQICVTDVLCAKGCGF